MLLYLVQHAEARSEAEDPTRDLTVRGLQDIQKVADYLGRAKVAVSRIWHSGNTRAASTAKILAGALKPPQGVSEATGLAPLDDPGIWAGRLSTLEEDTMLVGHLPHLARLAASLLCGDPEKGTVNFQMGGVVCLRRLKPGQWSVEWLIPPAMIPWSV